MALVGYFFIQQIGLWKGGVAFESLGLTVGLDYFKSCANTPRLNGLGNLAKHPCNGTQMPSCIVDVVSNKLLSIKLSKVLSWL